MLFQDEERTALSLFSGIGGFCEGVKLAGYRVVAAVEHDKYACHNYKLNFPEIPLYEGDIHEFMSDDSESEYSQKFNSTINYDRVDMIFGGPPCQGYSQIGERRLDDPRNELYLQVCRLAVKLQPKCILLENVPNMLLMNKGMFRKLICKDLTDIGYDNIGICILNAAEYGVPQERKRVFIIAMKSADNKHCIQDVMDSLAVKLKTNTATVDDAISDLPKDVADDAGIDLPYIKHKKLSDYQKEMRVDTDGAVYSLENKLKHYTSIRGNIRLHNHHTKGIQEKRLNLIKLLKPGKKADSLPKEVWDNARPEKWRRFDGTKTAHTLMAQMHRDLSEWVHPHLHRWITVREALRLQSFHDGFILETSEWQQLKQVGNAVPPLLGRIAALMSRYVLALADDEFSDFEYTSQLKLF